MARIPVAGPWITEREIAYVADAARNGWYEGANLYIEKFEAAFAAFVGKRHAMALPSCTSAIHLALLAADIGPGDEVVVPEATWIASAAPVSYVGAEPVFADIEAASWGLSAASLEAAITPRTRAVIPVDLYGAMPEYDAIRAVARRHSLLVIEDAAEAIGSLYRGRPAGSLGDVGVFSFHGSKTLTTGEGGMLVTDDEALFRRAQQLRDHGRKPGDRFFFNEEVGQKYKMSALQAALGLAQLERVDELVARKREIYAAYARHLAPVAGLSLNPEPPGTRNSYWMTSVLFAPELEIDKARAMAWLDRHGIDSRPFFHPLSSLPAYRDRAGVRDAHLRAPVAYGLCPYGVNLPSALNLDEEAIGFVCETLTRLARRAPQAA